MKTLRVQCLSLSGEFNASGFASVVGMRLAAVLFLTVSLFWLAGCSTPPAASLGGPDGTNVLRVGVTATMPPMIFKRNGEYAGIEADLARQLAADLGKTVRFVEVPWDKQIDALLEGRTDIIMSSMSITPARAMRIEFTRPYMKSGQTALVRRTEATAMRVGMFSSSTRVGTQRGTTGDYFVQQEFPRTKRVYFDTAQAGARALIDKRIDVFIHDAPVNMWLASVNEANGLIVIPTMLTQEYLAWGVRKDDASLRDAADAFLDKARQNGTLQTTIHRWLPQWQ